jgi:uncharacterized protein YndB with AHSA1/START domain
MDDQAATVRVVRWFPVPAERVFDAWLSPDDIGRWMFGPALRDEEVLRITVDARVDGSFSFVVRRQGQEIDHVGTYLDIERPRRLAFTWGVAGQSADESVVTIEISPTASGCELTLTHAMDPRWADYTERVQASWTKMVDALADLLAAESTPHFS